MKVKRLTLASVHVYVKSRQLTDVCHGDFQCGPISSSAFNKSLSHLTKTRDKTNFTALFRRRSLSVSSADRFSVTRPRQNVVGLERLFGTIA